MALDGSNVAQQRAYFYVAIILMPFAILAVVLRFVAVSRSAINHRSEDWFALASLVIYLAFDGVNFSNGIIANGRNAFGLLKEPEDFAAVRKLIYAALWTYTWQQLFAKFSVMSLYYRLFHINHRFSLFIYALVLYHIAWIIEVSVMLILHCQPLKTFWDPLVPGQCIREGTFIAVTESINSFGDFLLVALAISMVRILQLSKVSRWRLRVLFGSGAFAGIIGFIKIGMSFNEDSTYVFTVLAIWSNVQAAVGIVCCCAPVYKPILPGPDFWNRLTSKISLSSLKRGRYHSYGSDTSPIPQSGQRSGSEPGSRRRQQAWLQRDDGSSSRMVWSGIQALESSSNGGDGIIYPLEAIKVQTDIEVAR